MALEEYLKNNPTEKEEAQKEEALRLEDGGGGEDESSDDPETPRGQESQLKTNTPLGAGSGKTGGVQDVRRGRRGRGSLKRPGAGQPTQDQYTSRGGVR